MSELEILLQASVDLASQRKSMRALKDANDAKDRQIALLRARIRILEERLHRQFERSADAPALLRPQV